VTLDIDSSESPSTAHRSSPRTTGTSSRCAITRSSSSTRRRLSRGEAPPGNVHSREGWDEVLLPIIDRYRGAADGGGPADAAFALPAHLRGAGTPRVRYAIRLPANDVWSGRSRICSPASRPTESRAAGPLPQLPVPGCSWDRPRRVIAKVEHHLGELFPRVGFIVTTLTGTNRADRPLLQPARDGGAVDQGRQDRDPLDPALLSPVPGQRGAVAPRRSSPTISATCCVGSCSPSPFRTGRSRAFSSGCSRPAGG
jgi:hypothetical protein